MTVVKFREGQSGLPTPKSTHSYWHQSPSKILLGHRTTDNLPPTIDVVIVGSGISGSFAARELASLGRTVLLLEAREACWGATGRNGGHCQPRVYEAKPDEARFELATYEFIKDLIATHDIPCDWRTAGGVHAAYDEEIWRLTKKNLARLRRDAPDLADKAQLIDDKASLADLRVPHALGAVYQPHAAKLWPYKLVCWVLEGLLRDYSGLQFNLQTTTPVEHLQRVNDTWVVHTPRGQVVANHVLLATNAYTSYLLPAMTGLITPVRGQVAALDAPKHDVPLGHSYVWLDGGDADDYLIQRDDDKALILGGARSSAPGGEEGVWQDDEVRPEIATVLRKSLHDAVKLRAPKDKEEKTLHASYEWTGIMGYSRDSTPWLGQVPAGLGGADGLWISAGFTGHGMPVAARCGIAAARMIAGQVVGFDLPKAFAATEERAKRVRTMDVPKNAIDELTALLDE